MFRNQARTTVRHTASSPSPSNRVRPCELVVLGNTGSRRLEFLGLAQPRYGMSSLRVLPYIDYLQGNVRLADVIRDGSVVRVDSPGQDFEVERAILAEGIDLTRTETTRLDRQTLDRLTFDRGRILSPKQWYAGFSRVLTRLQRDRALCVRHRVMNDEESIAILFDKARCHSRLSSRGIPCPRVVEPIGSYRELRAEMARAGVSRVFVKLRYGSSGSGIVALESNGRRTQAFTTVEAAEVDGELVMYNSRKIRLLDDEPSISRLIDSLAAEDVHVEQWVPKAGLDGHTFDLRVVIIAGRPEHAVVRLSKTPMTNLHLGNRRGSIPALQSRMGDAAWQSLLETCRRVSETFPNCHYLGVDLAVLPGYRRHVVLEVNAFGDFLPGVLDAAGRDTYTAELESLAPLVDGSAP